MKFISYVLKLMQIAHKLKVFDLRFDFVDLMTQCNIITPQNCAFILFETIHTKQKSFVNC